MGNRIVRLELSEISMSLFATCSMVYCDLVTRGLIEARQGSGDIDYAFLESAREVKRILNEITSALEKGSGFSDYLEYHAETHSYTLFFPYACYLFVAVMARQAKGFGGMPREMRLDSVEMCLICPLDYYTENGASCYRFVETPHVSIC